MKFGKLSVAAGLVLAFAVAAAFAASPACWVEKLWVTNSTTLHSGDTPYCTLHFADLPTPAGSSGPVGWMDCTLERLDGPNNWTQVSAASAGFDSFANANGTVNFNFGAITNPVRVNCVSSELYKIRLTLYYLDANNVQQELTPFSAAFLIYN